MALPGGPAHLPAVSQEVVEQYFLNHGWKREDLHKITEEMKTHALRSMGVQERPE